jgi:hypothetical protein
MNGSVAAADELLLGVTMLTSPLAVAGPLVSLYVACAKGVAKYWLNVAAEICIGIAHGLLLFPLIQ